MQPDRLQRVRKGLHAVIRATTWIGAAVLIIMTLVVAINVVARYVFRKPLPGAIEIGALLLVVTVFLGIAYTEVKGQHVTFDEVVHRFPRRARSVVMSIMYFVAAAFFIVIGWQAVVLAISFMLPITRTTDVIHVPIYPVIFIIAIGAVLLGIELLLKCFFPPPLEDGKKDEVK